MTEATVISLFPAALNEVKPGIYPGVFTAPPAEKDDFQVMIVPDACYYVFIDDERGSLRVPVNSHDLARSICEDFIRACLEVTEDAKPGLFWIPGRHNKDTIKITQKEKLQHVNDIQKKWLMKLILMADDDWQKSRQFRNISDLQRRAAEILGLKKEWLVNVPPELVLCPVCKTSLENDPIICGRCQVVLKPEEYKKFSFVRPNGASVSSSK